MPQWKDEFRRKSAAKAADEGKRIDRSETYEHGDPEEGERTGGNLRMGVRAGGGRGAARFVPAGRAVGGVSMRAAGGAKFDIPGREPEPVDPVDEDREPPSAAKYLPKRTAVEPSDEPAPRADAKPKSRGGVFSRISSLFRRGE